MPASALQDLEILAHALLALALGGLIGFEREAAGKWAGLRTHMLVCLAALLFVYMGQYITLHTAPLWERAGIAGNALGADPIRIVQSIAVGVSFVGAGVIFRDPDRNVARGLTTAATLLVVAPIGVAVAVHRYVLAIGAALLVVFVLRVMNWVEQRFFDEQSPDDA
ncbi:MAG: MgtC/SapB family protein [Rhodothermaceae bacterium]|nr:MgtC/SapB family protein [Rhodothermaceae bacterium]